MTTKNQKQSGWKKYLMWVAIVFGVIIVYSAIVGDDEGSTDSRNTVGKSSSTLSGTTWDLDFKKDNSFAGRLFLNPDGSAQLTGTASGGNGRWSKKSGYEQGYKWECIQYEQNGGLLIYIRLNDGNLTDDWTMVIDGSSFVRSGQGFKLKARKIN
jgi:hypothetical protein